MSKHIEIHDTAFVTCNLRASNETVSHDIYAKLWNNKGTELWVDKYLSQVTQHEAIAHCLRNRYFLDTIKKLIETNNIKVLINFGCGFSMYPFLLDNTITHIEIDKPEIIEHKKSKVEAWQDSGVLPKRDIRHIGVDFSTNYKDQLLKTIHAIKNNKPTFILLEGVIFFLNLKETNNLFKLFASIQNNGDYIGSASFRENIVENKTFKKLLKFMAAETNIEDYLTLNDAYYNSIENYKLIDNQDYFSLSKTYLNKEGIDKSLVLNECFYILENKNTINIK